MKTSHPFHTGRNEDGDRAEGTHTCGGESTQPDTRVLLWEGHPFQVPGTHANTQTLP